LHDGRLRVAFSETLLLLDADSLMFNPDNGHYYEFYEPNSRLDLVFALRWSQVGLKSSGKYYMGHLLTITSQAEFDFIRNNAGAVNLWLALSDASTEGDWRWIDGPEAGLPLSWASWRTVEPDGGIFENCVYTFSSDMKWCDESCGAKHYAIIEYEPQSSIPGTITVDAFGINPNWSVVLICC
jgi:hypothetical protein